MKTSLRSSRFSKVFVVGLFLLAANSACNPVISKKAVGETPARLVAAEWDGSWITPDGPVNLKVIEQDKGILNASWIEEEQGRATLKTATVQVRKHGDWLFASSREDSKGQGRGYLWVRVKKEARQITIWEPDHNRFGQLVRDGVFAGKLDNSDVILEGLESGDLNTVISGNRGVLFQWDKPVIFSKVGN